MAGTCSVTAAQWMSDTRLCLPRCCDWSEEQMCVLVRQSLKGSHRSIFQSSSFLETYLCCCPGSWTVLCTDKATFGKSCSCASATAGALSHQDVQPPSVLPVPAFRLVLIYSNSHQCCTVLKLPDNLCILLLLTDLQRPSVWITHGTSKMCSSSRVSLQTCPRLKPALWKTCRVSWKPLHLLVWGSESQLTAQELSLTHRMALPGGSFVKTRSGHG